MGYRLLLLSWVLMMGLLGCGGDPSSSQGQAPTSSPTPPEMIASPSVPSPEPMLDSLSEAAPSLDGDRLFETVKALAGPRFDPGDRDRARQYLKQQLEAAGWTVESQTFDGGVNLIAQRDGTDANAPILLLGAHYDTVANSPGADDNASAVAAVLEAAYLLKAPTPRGLRLVLFDLEERGLQGSFAYVSPQTIENVEGAIILEMIGYACEEIGCQTYPRGLPESLPERGDFLGVVGNWPYHQLTDAFEESPRFEKPRRVTLTVPVGLFLDLLRSDHAPFWLAGVPAVMVTDSANFRNPNYHRPSDTPDSLNRPFLEGSTQAVVDVLYQLLNRPQDAANESHASGSAWGSN
ncbi:MAG: M28 family peptidase [Phormidium sp.]